MTLEQAREAIQKDYPNQEIGLGFEYENAWFFRVGAQGCGGIHAVNNETGFVTGNIPIMMLVNDNKFMSALKKASGMTGDVNTPDENFFEHDGLRSWRNEDFLRKNRIVGQKWSGEHKDSRPSEMQQYLAHQGIPGMKWGQRRFQDKDGHYTLAGKIRYGRISEKKIKEGIDPVTAFYAIEFATVASIVAASAVVSAVEHHNEKMGDKLLDKKKIADTSKVLSNENPPRQIEGEHTAEQDMAKINDAYGMFRPQTQNNCVLCSISMELRRRGYDVCARTTSEPVYTEEYLKKIFNPPPKRDDVDMIWPNKPAKYDKMTSDEKRTAYSEAVRSGEIAKTFKAVEKNVLKKYPEGARGLFSAVCPYMGVGHAMAFEVKNGKVIIYDTQSNKKFDLASPPAEFSQNFAAYSSTFFRLDDCKIDWTGSNEVCAERLKK